MEVTIYEYPTDLLGVKRVSHLDQDLANHCPKMQFKYYWYILARAMERALHNPIFMCTVHKANGRSTVEGCHILCPRLYSFL